MIDVLTAPIPDFVMVDGEKYEINTDFRVWIKIEKTLSDKTISFADKLIEVFALAFVKKIPSDIEKTISAIAGFLAPFSYARGKSKGGQSAPLFSFTYDGGLIYAAFLSEYGIDLGTKALHWWIFLSLFSSLNSCKFTEVVKIRGINLSAIKDPYQKSQMRQMKRLYRLPNAQSDISSELDKLI